MVHFLQDMLSEWYRDDTLHTILLHTSRPRDTKVPAFCAGGDVKQVYQSCVTDTTDAKTGNAIEHGQGVPGVFSAEFFRQEYLVNAMLANNAKKKPQISIWDGVVMGGGVGISIYGQYRIATENTKFAMPETGIGFFPDVGSMFWMPRLLGMPMARYMALTGARLGASDAMKTGLATHFVPEDQLGALEAALIEASLAEESPGDVLVETLDRFHEQPPKDPTLDYARIDEAFGSTESLDDIVRFLEEKQHENIFYGKTLSTLQKMSPTALKVTMEGLKRGSACENIVDDLKMEFRMAQGFMRPGSDFYEGIRAVLVDKDNLPEWNPKSMNDVSDEEVEGYFASLKHELELPLNDLVAKM